nr:unnamed protein product [Callosobruchus analis]
MEKNHTKSYSTAMGQRDLLHKLEFIINVRKSSLKPKQEITFLGFVFNTLTMSMAISKEKKDDIYNAPYGLKTKPNCTIKKLSSVIGKLVAACPAVTYGWAHIKYLERAKYILLMKYSKYSTSVTLPQDITKDIEWWIKNIHKSIKKLKFPKNSRKQYIRTLQRQVGGHITRTTRFMDFGPRLFQVKAKSGWEKFCMGLSRQSTPTAIWNRVNRIKSSKSPHSLNESAVKTLLHRIAPDYVPSPFFAHNIDYEQHVLLSPISEEELIANIKTSKCSAPGVDGINYVMIDNLPTVATNFLCSIYNRILIDGENCDQLKESLIIPIPKLNDPSTCRSISLMSCLLKTFERILKSRLEWWFEKNQLLPETQYGFRRGRGTIDCVSHLVTDIQINFSQNTYLSSLFLDISSAYDNGLPCRLHEKLLHMGVLLNYASTLVNFINRTVVIRCSDKVIGPRSVHKGLPQGSVISPLLFNIYTQDFHSMDIGWFWNQGLDLSPSKSSIVFFSRYRLPATDTIQLSDVLVPVRHFHTYLGVTLDSKLTWEEHINKTLTKCKKSLNIVKAVNRRRCGADAKINLLFYRAYTRAIIDYGCFLYGSASKTRLKKLHTMQYKALRLVVGAFKSTPTPILLAECQEAPLHLRRVLLAEKFIVKSLANGHQALVEKISTLTTYDLTSQWW